MRIERIEIRDFRGFPGQYHFDLGKGGNNLLVYGENGSGKSSLFHALKRFFEANAATDIQTQRNEFADEPEPCIKLEIAAYDESGDRDTESNIFEWSASAHPAASALIQQANKTKGCLDYRSLLETHYVHRDRQHVEIFDLLIRTVLTHVQNPISKNAFGEELAGIRADRRKDMRGGAKEVYLRRIKEFNQGLIAALETLNTQANLLLHGFFDDVELRLVPRGKLELTGTGRNKALVSPQVFVAATFCKQQTRLDLHHFLNEARLSALAIALYLATLLIIPPSRLRLLVLDDLLIGIDMSNRMAVLRILQERFSDWQIILMTHDRVWFEIVRMHTRHSKTWLNGSLRSRPDAEGKPVPLWKGYGEGWNTNLEVAKRHLEADDIRAAGVYARSAFEERLKRFCEDHQIPVRYTAEPSALKSDDFWKAVLKWIEGKGKKEDFSGVETKVEASRKLVLNPLSHEHPVNLVEGEIALGLATVHLMDEQLRALFPKKAFKPVEPDA